MDEARYGGMERRRKEGGRGAGRKCNIHVYQYIVKHNKTRTDVSYRWLKEDTLMLCVTHGWA